jgi:hypothetical protein
MIAIAIDAELAATLLCECRDRAFDFLDVIGSQYKAWGGRAALVNAILGEDIHSVALQVSC